MPTHVVRPGECLALIAARYGFSDHRAIYDHPDNAALKRRRPNPHILHPGDELEIPARSDASVAIGTDASHRFEVRRPDKTLKLRFLDGDAPLSYEPYVLEVDGETIHGTTDGDGALSEVVPIRAAAARVTVAGRAHDVRIGALNPMTHTDDAGGSGAAARLRNLGVDAGEPDPDRGPSRATRHALAMFQALRRLRITGVLDDDTAAALEAAHGS